MLLSSDDYVLLTQLSEGIETFFGLADSSVLIIVSDSHMAASLRNYEVKSLDRSIVKKSSHRDEEDTRENNI